MFRRMSMKAIAGYVLIVALLFALTRLWSDEVLKARAELINNQGKRVGNVLFKEDAEGVVVTVRVNGLPPGMHSLHIHDSARCESPDFSSAGGHFNPYSDEHGFLNPRGPHAGDLPNIMVSANGRGTMEIITRRVTLKEGKDHSLFQEGGTSVVIHQNPDDYLSDPAGKAGERIACGAIERIP